MTVVADFAVPEGYKPADHVSACRSCRAPILWCETPRGKRSPIDPDGRSHFSTCPDAERWRTKPSPRVAGVPSESPEVARFRQGATARFGLGPEAIDQVIAMALQAALSAPEPERAMLRYLVDWWHAQDSAEAAKDDDAEASA